MIHNKLSALGALFRLNMFLLRKIWQMGEQGGCQIFAAANITPREGKEPFTVFYNAQDSETDAPNFHVNVMRGSALILKGVSGREQETPQ